MVTNKRPLVLLAICAVLTALGAPFLMQALKSERGNMPMKGAFPQKISNRLSVPPQEKNEVERIDYYAADNKTLVMTEITYRNGITTYIYFRENKKAERMVEYYPSTPQMPDRALKTEVFYQEDGVLFVSHRSLREDGTLIKRGFRQENGDYRTLTFFTDGVTIEREQNFTKRKALIDETVFRLDGSKSRTIVMNKQSEREVTYLRPDKTVQMTLVLPYNVYTGPSGKVYSADGKTVLYSFDVTLYATKLTFLNPDETTNMEVRFEKTQIGHLTVNKYTVNSQIKFSQVYFRKEGTEHGCSGTYVLKQVDEYAADNSELGKRPFRRIYLSDDEKSVKAVAIPDQNYYYMGRGVLYELYPSGFVSAKKVYTSHKTIASDEKFPDEKYREKQVEGINPAMLQRPTFECPNLPSFDRASKSWIID